MRENCCIVGAALAAILSACNTPTPRPWLRFQPAGPHTWSSGTDGLLIGKMHGADVAIDLNRTSTRVQVIVENRSPAAVQMRIGAEAATPTGAIGEVLLRPLEGVPGTGGPDMMPYNTGQPVTVDKGWRGTFYLDAPLGGTPTSGQYWVLGIEARDQAQRVERRTLPLVATNSGTLPTDGR